MPNSCRLSHFFSDAILYTHDEFPRESAEGRCTEDPKEQDERHAQARSGSKASGLERCDPQDTERAHQERSRRFEVRSDSQQEEAGHRQEATRQAGKIGTGGPTFPEEVQALNTHDIFNIYFF